MPGRAAATRPRCCRPVTRTLTLPVWHSLIGIPQCVRGFRGPPRPPLTTSSNRPAPATRNPKQRRPRPRPPCRYRRPDDCDVKLVAGAASHNSLRHRGAPWLAPLLARRLRLPALAQRRPGRPGPAMAPPPAGLKLPVVAIRRSCMGRSLSRAGPGVGPRPESG